MNKPITGQVILTMACMIALMTSSLSCATVKAVEGSIKAFRGAPTFDLQQIFPGERFPNVIVAMDGTVLATSGRTSLQVRRSEDGGETWGDPVTVGRGLQGGGATVDETSGDILVFVEEEHPPAPLTVYRSKDSGKTWSAQETVVHPDSRGNVPSMHMNDHGITLRHGKHTGRLLRPARWYAEGNRPESLFPTHYTTAIYSDDGGKTWQTSEPFPEFGTGEAAVAELADGTVYYNTRRHWAPEGKNPRRRWHAWSRDGGQSWQDVSICEVLPDGAQNRDYGLMGGLVRLPVDGRDILLYSNIVSQKERANGHVWASFDGGKTWPIKRLVFKGAFAYSSLTVGRTGTSTEGLVYLLFEGGPKGGGTMARFNLAWLLKGEPTGDGELPKWIKNSQ
jgi:sialidase-1